MSELTPDGDHATSTMVAIRPFPVKYQPLISAKEVRLMQNWASNCGDPANAAKLNALVDSLRHFR